MGVSPSYPWAEIPIFGQPFCIKVVARNAACRGDSLDFRKTRSDASALKWTIVI